MPYSNLHEYILFVFSFLFFFFVFFTLFFSSALSAFFMFHFPRALFWGLRGRGQGPLAHPYPRLTTPPSLPVFASFCSTFSKAINGNIFDEKKFIPSNEIYVLFFFFSFLKKCELFATIRFGRINQPSGRGLVFYFFIFN